MMENRRFVTAGAVIGLLAWSIQVAPLGAQAPPPEASTDQVAVDALQCWRSLSQRAITIGETFTMTVSCRVVETETAAAIPNETTLAAETIELLPFEVVEGRRFPDALEAPFRVFQYEYLLRLIAEDAFGEDVELPPLEISYHIERALAGAGGTMAPGREVRYVLPAESLRVVSLVPESATNIRDPRATSLGEAETRLFRAQAILLAAAATGLGAAALFVTALVQHRRRVTDTVSLERRPIPEGMVVKSALAELLAVQRVALTQGWDESQLRRALTALRLAAATALSIPVAQEAVSRGAAERDGQVRVTHGRIRRQITAVSSAVTAETMRQETARRQPHTSRRDLAVFRDLSEAIGLLTAARYRAQDEPPPGDLTRALDIGIRAVRALRRRTTGPLVRVTRAIGSARQWWAPQWTH